MNRRELVAGLAAGLAAAALPGAALAAPSAPEEAPGWLARLAQDLHRMRQTRPLAPLAGLLRRSGLPETLLGETLAVLATLSAWRGADPALQQHPVFLALVLQAAERLTHRVAAVSAWLEKLPAARWARLLAELQRPNRLLAHLEEGLLQRPMGPTRRAELRRALAGLAAWLRGQDPAAVREGLLRPVDAAFAAEGLDRSALAAPDAAGGSTEAEAEATLPPALSPTMRVGLALAGVGVAVSGVGLLLATELAIGAVLCWAVGPVLLVIGALVCVVAYFSWWARVVRGGHAQGPGAEAPGAPLGGPGEVHDEPA